MIEYPNVDIFFKLHGCARVYQHGWSSTTGCGKMLRAAMTGHAPSQIKVAIGQVTGEPFAVENNLELTLKTADEAFREQANLVVLPELIVSGYALEGERLAQVAETIDGPAVTAWTALCAKYQGYIAAGFCERDGERLFNTAVIVGPNGVVLHYRKLHLFGREKEIFEPGDLGLPLAETDIGTIGICVCYDLRFLEVARAAALRGAGMLIVPTAWLPGYDQERWDRDGYCPQARGAAYQANHNQIYILCASQAGNNGVFDFLGSSLIADPYGKALVGPLSGTSAQLAYADLDLDKTQQAQQRDVLVSPRIDRRTDVYGIYVDGERF
jgi:predicted amidohydrolase